MTKIKPLRKRYSEEVKTLKQNEKRKQTILDLRDTLELPATAPQNWRNRRVASL